MKKQNSQLTPFQAQVYTQVKKIPFGKVVSYGQVAASLGMPRSARQVGWILHSLEFASDFPWWRVVNNQGRISIKGGVMANASTQKALLEGEGIIVNQDLTFEIEKYRFYF